MRTKSVTKPQTAEAEPQARDEAAAQIPELTWVIAALLESLILLGGLAWAISAPGEMPLSLRITLVVALAVLTAAGFALAVASRFRPRE